MQIISNKKLGIFSGGIEKFLSQKVFKAYLSNFAQWKKRK